MIFHELIAHFLQILYYSGTSHNNLKCTGVRCATKTVQDRIICKAYIRKPEFFSYLNLIIDCQLPLILTKNSIHSQLQEHFCLLLTPKKLKLICILPQLCTTYFVRLEIVVIGINSSNFEHFNDSNAVIQCEIQVLTILLLNRKLDF